MIIVFKAEVQPEAAVVKEVIALAESFAGIKTEVHQIRGAERSLVEVYLLGPTQKLATSLFSELSGVEQVVRITEKFRAISRHAGALETVGFTYKGVTFSGDELQLFPGLCAVDTREHVEQVFKTLQEFNIVTTRAGAYKPRTSPYDFQGHGAKCLPYVLELAGKYGLKIIAMEVTQAAHIEEITKALAAAGEPTGVMLQIGTRNAQNFELLKEVGQQTVFPVLFKRGMGITLNESLNACEYVAAGGNRQIIFCLRGVKTNLGDPHRNLVDFAHVPVVKRLTRLPVGIDVSHAVGQKVADPQGVLDIFHVAAQGVIAGANMILVDVHPQPQKALCDGPQALTLKELAYFLEDVAIARRAYQARLQLAKSWQEQNV